MPTATVNSGGGADYTSITAAHTGITAGDTINITGGGPYAETATITKDNVTVTASADVVVTGSDARSHCFDIQGENFTLDSTKGGVTYGGYITCRAALTSQIVLRAGGATIRKAFIDDGDGDSVVQGVSNQGTDSTIEYMDISGQAEHGIYCQTTNSGAIIQYNYIHGNTKDGCRILGSDGRINNNTISGNGRHGISWWADLPYVADGWEVYDNIISNNTNTNLALFALATLNPLINIYIRANTITGTSSQYNLAVIGIQSITAGFLTYNDALGIVARKAKGYVDEHWASRNTIAAAAANNDIFPKHDRGMLA